MKAVFFFFILGISAITSVAQTGPASALLPDTPNISALDNGTVTLDDSLESGAVARDPVSIPNAPSASLPQFTVNLAFAKNPDQSFSTSQTALYDFFVRQRHSEWSTGGPASCGGLEFQRDSGVEAGGTTASGHQSSLGKGQWGSPTVNRDHAHVQFVDGSRNA